MVEPFEQETGDHEVYLTTLNNKMDADVVEALLNSNDVPVLRKYKNQGGYISIYMGDFFSGIDFYVPSKSYELAKSLIDQNISSGNQPEINENGDNDLLSEEKQIQSKRSVRATWILLIFVAPILAYLIIGFIKSLWYLLSK